MGFCVGAAVWGWGVGCGEGAADGDTDGAGDGANVGEKDNVGGSVGFGDRVGDGVQLRGLGDGDGVGRGVSVGGVWGRGVGASVWAFVVASSSVMRSRRMALWARCQGNGSAQVVSSSSACVRALSSVRLPHKNRPCCAPPGPPCALLFAAGPSGGAT